MPKEIPLREKAQRVLSAGVLALLIREAFAPSPLKAQTETPSASNQTNTTDQEAVSANATPEMYRGIDIREVPELQLNFIGRLNAKFNSGSKSCTVDALLDPQTPNATRFILAATHCTQDRKDGSFNPNSITISMDKNPGNIYSVSKVVHIPGSRDSSIIVLDTPITLGQGVSALTIASEVADNILVAGYGIWEEGNSPPAPHYGEFVSTGNATLGEGFFDILPEDPYGPQLLPGDSGSAAVNATPSISYGPNGEEIKTYAAVGTLYGSQNNSPPAPNEPSSPMFMSAVHGPAAQAAVSKIMDQYRNLEIDPVPHTTTKLLVDGAEKSWNYYEDRKLIAEPGIISHRIELSHQADDDSGVTVTYSEPQLTLLNHSNQVNVTFAEAGTSRTLEPGSNLIGIFSFDIDPSSLNTNQNSWSTAQVSFQVTKTTADGTSFTETISYAADFDIINPPVYKIPNEPDIETAILPELSAKIESGKLVLTYTGTDTPSGFNVMVKLGASSKLLFVPLYENVGQVELPVEVRPKTTTWLPDINNEKSHAYLPEINVVQEDN